MGVDGKYYLFTSNLALMIRTWREAAVTNELRDLYNRQIEELASEIDRFKEKILEVPAGPKRAVFVNIMIQQVLDKYQKEKPEAFKDVQCKKGCAGCCHQSVLVSEDEAQLLAGKVLRGEVKIDRALLERQANQKGGVGGEHEWWILPMSEKRCVFLQSDNTCGVYEDRPASCRKYMVVTDPKLCSSPDTENVGVLPITYAEIIATAAADIDRNEHNLPKSLWAILKKS